MSAPTDPTGTGTAAAPSPGTDTPGLARGSLGAAHIVFMVLAAVAPAGVTVALLPLAIGLGVGVGTPGMIIVVALVLLVFSVGYTRMVGYVRNAGAMFAYIVKGLGRPAGLPGAYVALIAYLCIGTATVAAAGFFLSLTLEQVFGWIVPWWLMCLLILGLCLFLTYRRITLAAGVLAVALILEGAIVVILDIGILIHHGPGEFSWAVFDPRVVFTAGAVGVGIIYAFSGFQGFEGTAIYAEEAKEPRRSVPRATYVSIIIVAIFYALTAWALIVGGGGEAAPENVMEDVGNFAFNLMGSNVGEAWVMALQVLIITSAFAGCLAFQNAASRYMYALSRDGFLPKKLATVHPRHSSPYIAGFVSFAVMALAVLVFALAGLDPLTNLSSSFTGLGAIGLISLLATTSIAILVFFWRSGRRGWGYTVAPAFASVALISGVVLALLNYDAITGTDSWLINALPVVYVPVVIVGVFLALHARRTRPAAYESMGATRVD